MSALNFPWSEVLFWCTISLIFFLPIRALRRRALRPKQWLYYQGEVVEVIEHREMGKGSDMAEVLFRDKHGKKLRGVTREPLFSDLSEFYRSYGRFLRYGY